MDEVATNRQIRAVQMLTTFKAKIAPWYASDIKLIRWLNENRVVEWKLDEHKTLGQQLTKLQASELITNLNQLWAHKCYVQSVIQWWSLVPRQSRRVN